LLHDDWWKISIHSKEIYKNLILIQLDAFKLDEKFFAQMSSEKDQKKLAKQQAKRDKLKAEQQAGTFHSFLKYFSN
jgi:hypothetical protein